MPFILFGAWLMLLVGTLTTPWFLSIAEPGHELVRDTIRLSLAYYVVAVGQMLRLQPGEWDASGRGALARECWSLAWAAYLVHVALAFHFYHGWSHADAIRRTREVSGFGEGLYISHLFTLVWTVDVVYWWLQPRAYAARSPSIGRTLHGFMAFIVFNGTVVFAAGPTRWIAAMVFLAFGG